MEDLQSGPYVSVVGVHSPILRHHLRRSVLHRQLDPLQRLENWHFWRFSC